jgi:hypothetical protein
LAASGALADEPKPEGLVSFSGFGTLGCAHNSTAQAEFIRDILQPRGVANTWNCDLDSRVGFQVNARPTADIEVVVQVVSNYNYTGSYRPELTWAFVSYSPDPDFKARVGRLGWDVYMLSDSRNVGYSYLWVRPPVDYFGPLQIPYFDGADAVFKHELGGGLVSAKVYGGRADQKVPSGPDVYYDLAGSRVLGANLDYQIGDWQFRAGYTSFRAKNELPGFDPLFAALRGTGSPIAADLATDLALADKTIAIMVAGAVYEHGPWQAQLMFNRQTSNSLIAPQKDSGYFLLGYRSGQWTPFVMLSATKSKADPQRGTGFPTPNPLDDAVSMSLAAAQSRERTLSLGLRYDVAHNVDLKIQLDRVQVQDHAAFLWRNPQPDWNGRATIFSLALDFVF